MKVLGYVKMKNKYHHFLQYWFGEIHKRVPTLFRTTALPTISAPRRTMPQSPTSDVVVRLSVRGLFTAHLQRQRARSCYFQRCCRLVDPPVAHYLGRNDDNNFSSWSLDAVDVKTGIDWTGKNHLRRASLAIPQAAARPVRKVTLASFMNRCR